MRALRWILGIGAVVVVLAGLAIALAASWLNTYIHSDAFKTEVESRATASLGSPVQVEKIDFDIFHGVKLQGLVTQVDPAHAGGQGALQVKVASVNCSYAWTELLSRKLKLTGVTLDQPQVILTKQVTVPAAPLPPTGSLDSGAMQGEGTAMPFQFILDRAQIKNGSLTVRDATGTTMVELQGVDVNANTSGYTGGGDVTGTAKITDAALPSNLHVTNFSTPFTFSAAKGAFSASPFEASAFGGTIGGGYEMQGATASVLDLNGKGFDMTQLTASTTSNSSAKLSGTLDFQSKWRGVETGSVNGEGDAQLANGRLTGVSILDEVAGLFKVKELKDPVIKKAQTHFVVQDRQTKFIGLQLESDIFKITGDGVIGFDGGVDANLVLILTKDAMAKLPRELSSSFVQQQDGTGTIAFHVTGTTANPQTDLAQRMLMQNTDIKNVINKAINKFFH